MVSRAPRVQYRSDLSISCFSMVRKHNHAAQKLSDAECLLSLFLVCIEFVNLTCKDVIPFGERRVEKSQSFIQWLLAPHTKTMTRPVCHESVRHLSFITASCGRRIYMARSPLSPES